MTCSEWFIPVIVITWIICGYIAILIYTYIASRFGRSSITRIQIADILIVIFGLLSLMLALIDLTGYIGRSHRH